MVSSYLNVLQSKWKGFIGVAWLKKERKHQNHVLEAKKAAVFPPETLPFVCIEEPPPYCSLLLHIDILDIIRKAKYSSRLWWALRDILNDSALSGRRL